MRIVVISVLCLFCAFSVIVFFTYYKRNSAIFSYDIVLPTIFGNSTEFNTSEIKKKRRAFVVNVFASWCAVCMQEHQTWKEISKRTPIDLYGIDYIDIEDNALAWLQEPDNPYIAIAADYSGKAAKAFGVTGVPETFIFNKKGELVLHIKGSITWELWQERVAKLIS
ncbi:Thiol:disulfide interchange protein DsbE [Anaplasma phagocytophilum]|uniref:AhpC/TSA family protein n=1 Tax=Anaplasma phagocytophilum str. ApMUC09 TaxID=1359152 RepID=A0A0F3NA89_ANAPH|nr:ahpC/TSA family protein [Anaplasma phagocytophilum str. ApMUC09]SCV62789.1 Thiol:disulfide interchange protein DsbE [Anaplasma phagocytophilum]SCV63272.1 Thiol:disulfide interchange protein DsbE [Anaplasma phagocytophilum]